MSHQQFEYNKSTGCYVKLDHFSMKSHPCASEGCFLVKPQQKEMCTKMTIIFINVHRHL